ncbi:glycosyltransferase family 4 protein [Micromonospora parva]|uniref:glycosyltransferase family 4 protein n=1 Tax=Micromonospora parva TaxID=1464048 RepID=UPI003661A441
MRVVVTSEARFSRTPDGAVWTTDGPDHSFWGRYLTTFHHVRVMARVREVEVAPEGVRRVDGDDIDVWPVPYYVGPRQYMSVRPAIQAAVRGAASAQDAVILRVPSAIGTLLARHRDHERLPYGVEVVADPYDVFAPGVIRHPLRPLLRRRFVARLRHECRTAVAASYVTERHLQSRYPTRTDVPTVAASSIDLSASAFAMAGRRPSARGEAHHIITVGTMDQMYKGFDTLITAVARLNHVGVPARMSHIGTGRFQPCLEQLAARLGVADKVAFVGWCSPGEELRQHLDAADLFVMPSRTEGLPRALIEAMARALPAVGTRVGGIPELLPPTDMVRPDDPRELARVIGEMLQDPDRMSAASARNLAHARRYSRESLNPRREAFYQAVCDATKRPITTPSR